MTYTMLILIVYGLGVLAGMVVGFILGVWARRNDQ